MLEKSLILCLLIIINSIYITYNFVFREHANPEHKALDAWNPMSEDYESKAFNSYKEPSVTDFIESFQTGYVLNHEAF